MLSKRNEYTQFRQAKAGQWLLVHKGKAEAVTNQLKVPGLGLLPHQFRFHPYHRVIKLAPRNNCVSIDASFGQLVIPHIQLPSHQEIEIRRCHKYR